MSTPSRKLSRPGAQLELSFETISTASGSFQRWLRDLEAGTAALNLTADAVHLATEIAAFEPDLDDEERIALILLVVISLVALEEGSTRVPVTGPQSVEPMRRMLGPLCGASFGGIERMRANIERLLTAGRAAGVIGTAPTDYRPLVYVSPYLYQHRILATEITVGRKLADLIGARRARVEDSRIHELVSHVTSQSVTLGGKRVELSEEQGAAIECAAASRLAVISGGPGTGKTSIVIAILRRLVSAGLDPREIALAAPTGKAAYRIRDSIRDSLVGAPEDPAKTVYPDPTTVHRLLGYSPTRRRFRYHRNNPLEAKVVIVDEGSMLDLELMASLLDALPPDGRLVILGDADQLPSVSAGAVFRDLMPVSDGDGSPLSRSCVRLTRSYRTDNEEATGRAIFDLAGAIRAGNADVFALESGDLHPMVARRASAEELEFEGAEWLDQAAPSGELLERWYMTQIHGDAIAADLKDRIFIASANGFAPSECESLRRVFESVARSRILCVTHVLDTGSERINSLLHRRVAHHQGASFDRERFLIGEPVMVLRNDYQRMLFNGDHGIVLRVRRPDHEVASMAVFAKDDNFLAFPIDALKEHLELSYATTVHKAQGSEFDSVVVIMPNKDLPILTREILYTAASRARRSVTIVGTADTIRAGISRRMERYSGVREQIERCLIEMQRA